MNNPNPVMTCRPKPSVANIIGFCGFALFALAEIIGFSLYYYIMSAVESGEAGDNIEFLQFLFDLRKNISDIAFPIAYIAIGCFFVMDMKKREGGRKIIDIIGLIAVGLILICSLRDKFVDLEGMGQYQIKKFVLISNYFWYSGFILLMLFFAGFVGNKKLFVPSLFVVIFTVVHWTLFMIRTDENYVSNYKLGTCADILAICSMVWFMYQYMRIGGAEVNFRIKIKPESQVAVRSISAGLCLCLGLALVFLPFIDFEYWGGHFKSLYDFMPDDFKYFMEDYGSAPMLKMIFFTFIPAIVLYAASIKDRGVVKPIIALALTLIPFITMLSEGIGGCNNWIWLLVILYVALIGLTITIVANSRNQIKAEEQDSTDN